MDKRLYGIFLVMTELGGFNIEDLEDRVFFQKAVYLVQLLGVDFRFRFAWYIRGPFSKDLSSCGMDIKNRLDEISEKAIELRLKPEAMEQTGKLWNLIQHKPDDLENSRWLELVSSIHYLRHISLPSPSDISLENAGEKLSKLGKSKDFKNDHIIAAWKALDEIGLLNKKSLPQP